MSSLPSDETPMGVDAAALHNLLMENVKDFAIFFLDPTGRIATWNVGAERILGYSANEIIGQPFSLLFTPQDIVNHQPEHELKIAMDKGRSEDERWHLRKDGTQFWASGVVTPLWDQSGSQRGFAKVLRDITDRKRAEMELADRDQRKDEFLAMLAHELRNPLAPILNALHLIRQEGLPTPTQTSSLAMIERQVQQLMRLVDDLLDVSRITKGKIHLRVERVPLARVVEEAVETASPLIKKRGHELHVNLPSEAIWLEVDPPRMVQVLGNLLNNAAKYTEPTGHIWLTAEREGPYVVIRVRDTGIGILPEMLPRIFDLFVQADRSLERSQGGLGIGLTLVKSLVSLHEGQVEAHSPGVGMGSEFIVRLLTVHEVEPLPTNRDQVASIASPKLRLAVVDDNADTVASLAMLLRIYGHEVETARNGPDGLTLALTTNPDAVLMDIGLPGMDGYEVARRIRDANSDMVLIAMTGYGQPEDRERTRQAGYNHHLVKPVDPEALRQLLGTLLPHPRRVD